jgi:uncharacterized protein
VTSGPDLSLLPGRFAVCRLEPRDDVPAWVPSAGALVVIARTTQELSIVCDAGVVPESVRAERDLRAFVVHGPLPFDAVGIMAALSGALAAAGIPLFALSTFDTDYVLVREDRVDEARMALGGHGFLTAMEETS